MKTFDFKLKNNQTYKMEFDEFVRWMCLVEAMETISEGLASKNIPADDTKWVKPLAIEKYIYERFHSMKHDIKVECTLGHL